MVRLAYKIALTYLLVISVVVISVIITVGFRAPIALEHHVQAMEEHFGADKHLEDNLRTSFIQAMKEIFTFSVIIATTAAIMVTVILSRKVVTPIKAMSAASRRIADGQFRMRVEEAGNDELTDLARSFNQMAQNLESTEERRIGLIGDVAHELRTPLSGIISLMEGVSDGVIAPDEKTFSDVLNEANRLKRLVNDLEELSRLSGDHVEITKTNFNLELLIEEIVRRFNPQFEGKGIELQFQSESMENSLCSDPNRINQIIQNLLSNALRYTTENGKVNILLIREPSQYKIIVEDTGLGIPHVELNRIFERFYRIDASRSRTSGGSGIGLAVSIRLAHLLSGDISANSDGQGKGSTFTLSIPHLSE